MNGGGNNHEEGEGSNRNNRANPTIEATMAKMLEYFERQESRIDRQTERMERMEQVEHKREAPVIGDDVALERFLKFHPPRFAGGVNEEEAERWMEAMSDIYATLHYENDRKVQFAAFQLEGPAKAWWRMLSQKWDQTGVPRTWNAFLEEFKIKFIPLIVRDKREEEFINLKQRAMTVAQYEVAFTRLSKYAPEMVNNENKRKKRFIQGLHVKIQNALTPARMETFTYVVDFAQRVEDGQNHLRDYQNSKKISSHNWAATRGQNPQSQRTVPPRGPGGVKRSATEMAGPPEKKAVSSVKCDFCGKPNHTEANCWRKTGQCLRCGGVDHHVRNCFAHTSGPVGGAIGPGTRNPVGKAKMPARAYALNVNPAEKETSMDEGTPSVSSPIAKILIDLGTTHSHG